MRSRVGERSEMESLYPRLLGDGWSSLPDPVRRLHVADGRGPFRGTFAVTRGTGILARLVSWLSGLPAAGEQVPVTLQLRPFDGGQLWQRTFAGRSLASLQYRHEPGMLAERFGLAECRFRMEARDGSLVFVQTGSAIRLGPIGVPLSWGLGPRIVAHERAAGPDSVEVDVAISLAGAGLLVRYQGEIWVGESS